MAKTLYGVAKVIIKEVRAEQKRKLNAEKQYLAEQARLQKAAQQEEQKLYKLAIKQENQRQNEATKREKEELKRDLDKTKQLFESRTKRRVKIYNKCIQKNFK